MENLNENKPLIAETPFYPFDVDVAREKGELDQWRKSRNANISCAKDIATTLQNTIFCILPQTERNINMLGSKIKGLRKAKGLSCSKLARLAGHSVSSIHGIETGANKNPRFEIIFDISDVLGISADDSKREFQRERR